MNLIEKIGLTALQRMDPEKAHGLAIKALQKGVAPLSGSVSSSRLRTSVAGVALGNPVGLAKGDTRHGRAQS